MAKKKRPQFTNSLLDPTFEDDASLPSDSDNETSTLILERLRASNSKYVTYAQIENELLRVGLDPFTCTDLYNWLLEQLDHFAIKVLDEAPIDNSPTVEQLTEEADELEAYYKEISEAGDNESLPLLTASEERRLLEIVRDGHRAQQTRPQSKEHKIQLLRRINTANNARNELVERNQRLVYHLALKFLHAAGHLELDDIAQEGNFGLLKAIEKFDLDFSGRFSTYAVWWIRQAISRAMSDKERLIRLPVHRVEEVARFRRAEIELEKESRQKPTDCMLAMYLDLFQPASRMYLANPLNAIGPQPLDIYCDIQNTLRRVRYLRQVSTMDPISYDIQVKDGENASTLADLIPDKSVESIEDKVSLKLLKDHLAEILEGLDERERKILNMRFGLKDGTTHTLEEVGKEYDVTRERVRQIEAKALRKLRHPQRSRKLRDYLR